MLSRPAAFKLSWRTSDDFPVSREDCSATKAGALPLQVCCFHGPVHCSKPLSRRTTSRREGPMRPGAGFSNKAQVGGGSPPPSPPHTHMQNMKTHPGPSTPRAAPRYKAQLVAEVRCGRAWVVFAGHWRGERGGRVPAARGPTASHGRTLGARARWRSPDEKVGLSFPAYLADCLERNE